MGRDFLEELKVGYTSPVNDIFDRLDDGSIFVSEGEDVTGATYLRGISPEEVVAFIRGMANRRTAFFCGYDDAYKGKHLCPGDEPLIADWSHGNSWGKENKECGVRNEHI